MSLLAQTTGLKKIAIIGLAKNTGKTVAMQTLINELFNSGISYGITSIGHDGEKFDQINYLIRKPSIYMHTGSLVSTTDKLLNECNAKIEIVIKTDYFTPLGRVCIARIIEPGEIEVAGPSTSNGIADVTDQMLKFSVEKVLIDGAINRKAIANPELSHGIFIATGAVLSPLLSDIVKETYAAIVSFQLPCIKGYFNWHSLNHHFNYLINSENKLMSSIPGTLLNQYEIIEQAFKKYGLHDFFTFKTVTERFLDFLLLMMKKHKNNNLRLILNDHTKLFLENKGVTYYSNKGLFIQVLHPVNILAVTVNPVAPLSHSFNSDQLVAEIQQKISPIAVLDVLKAKSQLA